MFCIAVNNLISRVAKSEVSVSMSMIKLHHSQKSLIALLFSAIFFITACGKNESENSSSIQSLKTIDMVEAYDNREEVPLSSFAKSIEYIPLETSDNSLLGGYPSFYLSNDTIITVAFRQLYLFNREKGQFMKEIRNYGEGPEDYSSTKPLLPFDEDKSTFFISKKGNLTWELNSAGKVISEFSLPSDENYVMGFTQLQKDLFVGYNANPVCDQKNRLTVFNSKGETVKTFPNPQSCTHDMSRGFSFDFYEGAFFRDQGKVYFKEEFNDTLFHVTPDQLRPQLVFNSQTKGIPYEEKTKFVTADLKADYFVTRVVDVTEKNVFFRLTTQGQTFNGIYSFETEETLLSDIGRTEMHGFINDLDNFLPFVPQYATDNNQLVGYIEAQDVLAWFKENPEKSAQLPDHLKKLGDMKPDDNPVVMIVDLKD